MNGRLPADRRPLATAAGAALLLLGSIVAADRAGRSSRSPEAPAKEGSGVTVVSDSAAAARHWEGSGLHGQVLVYASHFLHFVAPPETAETPPLAEFPYESRLEGSAPVDHRNLLWMAVRRDVARRLTHLVPRSVLREKVEEGSPVEPIRVQDFGTLRRISDRLSDAPEGSPLGIDAALLISDDGRELAERLFAARSRFGDVVFNLAEDNPAVDDRARVALRDLAARWVPGTREGG